MVHNDRLNLIDVGGLGGLKPEWLPHLDKIHPVVFEPNPGPAAALKPLIESQYGGLVIDKGLGSKREYRILNLTASSGCTSILQPNDDFLSDYSVRLAFEVRGREIVECERYDALHSAGLVPAPECIKIDVQGFEFEVLQGFGSTLNDCLGIELEAHFYPIYRDQKLLADLIAYLEPFGLILRRTMPVHHFDGYQVEVDAHFTCGPRKIASLSPAQLSKLELIEQVWGLPIRSRPFVAEMFP